MCVAGRGMLLVAVTAGQGAGGWKQLLCCWGPPGPSCGPGPAGRARCSLRRGKEGAGVVVPVVQFSFKYRLLSKFLHRKCRNPALGENRVFQGMGAEPAAQRAAGLLRPRALPDPPQNPQFPSAPLVPSPACGALLGRPAAPRAMCQGVPALQGTEQWGRARDGAFLAPGGCARTGLRNQSASVVGPAFCSASKCLWEGLQNQTLQSPCGYRSCFPEG